MTAIVVGMAKVLWVAKSRNRKLGKIPCSIVSGETCPPGCPFNGTGCYAQYGKNLLHWSRAFVEGLSWAEFCARVAARLRALVANKHVYHRAPPINRSELAAFTPKISSALLEHQKKLRQQNDELIGRLTHFHPLPPMAPTAPSHCHDQWFVTGGLEEKTEKLKWRSRDRTTHDWPTIYMGTWDFFDRRYAEACRQIRTRGIHAEDRFQSDPEDP